MRAITGRLSGLAPHTGRSWDEAARRPGVAIDRLRVEVPKVSLSIRVSVNGYMLALVLEYKRREAEAIS